MGAPGQPSKFRQGGLVLKPVNILDLGQQACRVDRAQAGDAEEASRQRDSLKFFSDGSIYSFEMPSKGSDVGQRYAQHQAEGAVMDFIQAIGVSGRLLESSGHFLRLGEAATAVPSYTGGEFFQGLDGQFIQRELLQHCLAGGAKRVFKRGRSPELRKSQEQKPQGIQLLPGESPREMIPEAGEALQRPIDRVYSKRRRQVTDSQPLSNHQGIHSICFPKFPHGLLEIEGPVGVEDVYPCIPRLKQGSLTQEAGQVPSVDARSLHPYQEDGSPMALEDFGDLLRQFLSPGPVVTERPAGHDLPTQMVKKTSGAGLQRHVQPQVKGLNLRRSAAQAEFLSHAFRRHGLWGHNCSSFPAGWYVGIPGSPVRATSSQHENLLPTQGCAGLPAATARRSMGRRTASALEVPTVPGGQSYQEVYATGGNRPIPYRSGLFSIPGFPTGYNRNRDQNLFQYISYE